MKTPDFLTRPRYLRAIPSLMLLTTAMAWGMSPDGTDSDGVQKKARVTLSQAAVATRPLAYDNDLYDNDLVVRVIRGPDRSA